MLGNKDLQLQQQQQEQGYGLLISYNAVHLLAFDQGYFKKVFTVKGKALAAHAEQLIAVKEAEIPPPAFHPFRLIEHHDKLIAARQAVADLLAENRQQGIFAAGKLKILRHIKIEI